MQTFFNKIYRKSIKIVAEYPILGIILLCIPIIVFMLPMLMTGNNISPGDPDYIFHLAEAGRKSIIEYHQFPWWDPWLSGGIPLFGSIIYGLVSLQTPFTLVFGAVIGWKLAIVAYQIVGFFGFKKLFQESFGTERLRAILLAYIPVLGSFFIYRAVGGHSPFLLLVFFPWLLHFFLQRRVKRSWLWFALVLSFMVWTSPHYITIMSVLIVGIWFFYELAGQIFTFWRTNKRLKMVNFSADVLFFVKAFSLTGILCIYRMFFAATFIRDFPRPEFITSEPFTGVVRGLQAIWSPFPYTHALSLPSGWGWMEASSYIGLGSLAALVLIGLAWIIQVRKHSIKNAAHSLFTYSPLILITLFVTFFTLGMGDFSKYSPYSLLHNLPIFSSMRVATRWLMWSSLIALFLIAAYRGKRFRVLINLSILAVLVEFFAITWGFFGNSFTTQIQQYRPSNASFDEVYHYRIPRPLYALDANYQKVYFYDENLYETTLNDYGQVIAGDPLVDTRQPNSTIRCGKPEGNCNFISNNARVTYWSPNKIVLKRLGPGIININMNPGRGWMVNGKYAFIGYKVTDPLRPFLVTDSSETIVLQYVPKYSIEWLFNIL